MTLPSFHTFEEALSLFEQGKIPQEAMGTFCQTLVQKFPSQWEGWVLLARHIINHGAPDQAIALLTQATQQIPNQPNILLEKGRYLRATGAFGDAATALSAAQQANPDQTAPLEELAQLFLQLGKQERAMDLFKQVLQRDQTHLVALNNLAVLATQRGHLPAAERFYRQALQHHPHQAELHSGLGQVLKETGRSFEAIASYEAAAALRPDYPPAWFGIGAVWLDQGEPDTARTYFHKALQLDPNFTKVWPHLVKTKRYDLEQDAPEIDAMERTLRSPGVSPPQQAELHYALGKALDDCTAYDRAFSHIQSANDIRAAETPFDPQVHQILVQSIISTFTPDWLTRWQEHGNPSSKPIFIVGLPRSGTSLVEQILASHPHVHGAGELEHFHRASQILPKTLDNPKPFPGCLTSLTPSHIDHLASAYLTELEGLAGETPRVVNKMPGDFLYLGLIRTLFPNATLIHCRRNLLDTAISLYFQDFGTRHPYSASLEHIGTYMEQYLTLADHWRNLFPDLFELVYEDLIDDTETVSRALLHHCGLTWHAGCLDFHKTKRSVNTASNWQVKQPVYRSSVARWRRYERWIVELSERLKNHLK
ncbi:MAG: sulfotransferase [Magnetococcales bacterium]|nr:sulfotransferase [Magnetococcales bacterium]